MPYFFQVGGLKMKKKNNDLNKKTVVALIGAYDRNNYGDLLMPMVFERQYRKNNPKMNDLVIFEYYGQEAKDMSYVKSYNTNALVECYQNCDVAIIVGGETFSSDYRLMYFNLQTNYFKLFFFRLLNKVFPKAVEKLCRKLLYGKEKKPWILDKDKLNCQKLIYNTVGGNCGYSKEVLDALKKVDYLAIRNEQDYKKLQEHGINTQLYPDSVVTLSTYFSSSEIKENCRQKILEMTAKKYYVFQINKRDGMPIIDEIVKSILSTCEKMNMECILVPIGYAQGHEDQVVLKKIKEKCASERVKFVSFANIYETMYIIKQSEIFVGTSLHGVITALTFGVPHMFFTSKIPKVLNYMNTWESTPIHYTEAKDMDESIKKLLETEDIRSKTQKIAQEFKEKIEENFTNINKLINEVVENDKKE